MNEAVKFLSYFLVFFSILLNNSDLTRMREFCLSFLRLLCIPAKQQTLPRDAHLLAQRRSFTTTVHVLNATLMYTVTNN